MRTLAILALGAWATAADGSVLCFPEPLGCHRTLHDPGGFGDREPLRLPRAERPSFVLPSLPTDVPLDPRRGGLAELDGGPPDARDLVTDRRPLRRMRPRGDSVLPPVSGRPVGRDPRAVQRFQAPYRFD